MAQRDNRDFGELRETAPTDQDFYRALGEKMGRSRSTTGKRVAAIGVWVVVIAFLALTVLSAFQVNTNRNGTVKLQGMITTQYNPSFKTRYSDLGKEIINSWYDTNVSPAPVQLADGVSWPHTGTSDLTDIEANNQAIASKADYTPSITVRNVTYIGGRQEKSPTVDGQFYEIDMYSAYVDGTLSNISVTLTIPSLDDYTTLPTLMNEPSILPSTASVGKPTTSDAPNWRGVSATDNFTTQLESWAAAYTANDSSALKQITGDNSGSFYVGAVSDKTWQYIKDSAKVVWIKENNGNTNEAVAQVTWQMKLPDTTVDDPNSDDSSDTITQTGATQTQRLEILIKSPGSGLPLIVAWGPVGSYATLTEDTNKLTQDEYNAITGSVTSDGGSDSGSGTDSGTTSDNGSTPAPTDSSTGKPSD